MNNGPKAPCQGTIASGAELPMDNNFLHFQKSEISHNMAASDVKVSSKFLQASRRLTRNANPIELQQRGKIEGILLVALAQDWSITTRHEVIVESPEAANTRWPFRSGNLQTSNESLRKTRTLLRSAKQKAVKV